MDSEIISSYKLSSFNDTADNDTSFEPVLLVGIYLNNYYLWVILLFGFPGNLASVITILRMQEVTTATFYVACLAIIDNFSIVLKLVYHQLTLNEVYLGPIGCKLLNMLVLIFPTCANWILVFIATERLVAVLRPLKIGMYWTITRAKLSVVVMAAVCVLIYLHLLWTFSEENMVCEVVPRYLDFYIDAWYWMNTLVYSLIPCILLMTLNVIIIRSVRKSSSRRKKISMKNDRKSHNSDSAGKQDSQITFMLISVALVFVALTVPRCIYVFLHLYWKVDYGTLDEARKYLVDQITFVLSDSNHAINFYLYFITGKKFRRHFLSMIFCRRPIISGTNMSQSGLTMTMHTKYKLANTDEVLREEEI